MRKTIILILLLFLGFSVQLAYGEGLSSGDDNIHAMGIRSETVIQDSNSRQDVGCSVILHPTYYSDSGANYLCYIFSPDGKKVRTIH